MPDATKKPTGSAKSELKAPLIGSPTKSKSSPGVKVNALDKETVKLPSIGVSPPSPAKKTTKNEPKQKTLPSTSSTTPKAPPPSPPTSRSTTKSPRSCLPVVSDASVGEEPSGVVATMPLPELSAQVEAEAEAAAAVQATTEAADAAVAAEADVEAERVRKENGNGMVKLIYEQYDELFAITDGSTTQAAVDDTYCLSFVMPNCLVHLSIHPNAERFDRENAGVYDSLVREEPRGVYHDLVKDHTYYVVIEQEVDQLRRDQAATKAKWAPDVESEKQNKKDDGRGFESCSCIYGNPCADEYGCKDWHSRFAIATANGWKGF